MQLLDAAKLPSNCDYAHWLYRIEAKIKADGSTWHAARLTCLNKVSIERQPMSCIWMFAVFLEHVLDIAPYQLDICGQICVCACILKTGCHWWYQHATHTQRTTPFFQKMEFTGMLWFQICYQWTLQHFSENILYMIGFGRLLAPHCSQNLPELEKDPKGVIPVALECLRVVSTHGCGQYWLKFSVSIVGLPSTAVNVVQPHQLNGQRCKEAILMSEQQLRA